MMKRSLNDRASDLDSSSFFGVKRSKSSRFDATMNTFISQGIETPNSVFQDLRRYLVEPERRDHFVQREGLTHLCHVLSITLDPEKQVSILQVLLTLAHHKVSVIELEKSIANLFFLITNPLEANVVYQHTSRLLAAVALNAAYNSDLFKPENIQRLEHLAAATDNIVQENARETLLNLLLNDNCRVMALSSATIASLFRRREQEELLGEYEFLEIILKLSRDESNFSGIREAGGIALLLLSLDQPGLRKNALVALANLSTSASDQTFIRESGAIPVLISLLQDYEDVLKIMFHLSKNIDNHAVIHANQCVEALVNVIISQNNIKALGVVLELACNAEYRLDIASKISNQVIDGLVKGLHSRHGRIIESAFGLLCEMKLETADIQTIRRGRGIDSIVKFLDNIDLRGQAAKLLVELSKDQQSLQILHDSNGITHLIPLLTDDDSQTQRDATTLLQALQSCHPTLGQTHQRVSTLKSIPYDALCVTAKKLGRGSFGQVVQGQWLQHTPVAIKMLLKTGATKEDLQELKDEGILHSGLNHPNIVALYGAYQGPGQYGLVLELLPDGSLSQVIARKKLTCKKRQAYAMDICRGLAYLNTQLIVHGDLKPHNILIGGGGAKLADFGHAQRLVSRSQLTTGQVSQVCTWNYAAPEVIQYRRASFASDVWSLSIILWEMAIGTWPYKECKNTDEIKQRIQAGEKPGTLQAVQEKTSQPYADLIAACWKARAEERPSIQSVAESVSHLPK
ncbi:MAG: protein kinase [Legionellaceae bacterium]|nr:protein kinase [Legionellaceae bacterium]